MKHKIQRIYSMLKRFTGPEYSYGRTLADRHDLATRHSLAENEKTQLSITNQELNEQLLKLQEQFKELHEHFDTYKLAFENTELDRNIWQERSTCAKAQIDLLSQCYIDLYEQLHPNSHQPLPVYGLPNFFCVGVQKTATSFLYSILREHSQIEAAAKDTGALRRFVCGGSTEDYLGELGEQSQKPVFAHFDVNTIDYPDSACAIHDGLCEDARILICLRNPIDRALSEWKMRARTIRPSGKWAETLDFISAIENENERAEIDPVHHSYIARSLYAEAVKDYFDVFGRDRVKVVIMEQDLGKRTPLTLIDLFRFISLLDAEAIRISMKPNDQFYQTSKAPSRVDVECDGHILKISSDNSQQISAEVVDPVPEFVEHAKNLNDMQTFKPTHEQRQNLFKRYFEKDVAALEKLLERDLSCWRP